MGNDFVKPSRKNILQPSLFAEYREAKLSDLKECSAYLAGLNHTGFLNQNEFEDTFGVLFKDPDPHFALFEKSAIETQIPLPMREDDKQPFGTVDPLVVCTIISLLAKDSVDKKFVYLYDLHFKNETHDLEENIKRMTDHIMYGILALFKVQKLPPKNIQYAGVITSLHTMRNSQRLQNEVDEAKNNENKFTLSDFFQLCQESQMISKLLNQILQLCSRHQVVQSEHQIGVTVESKLVSNEENTSEKIRHPLWNFYIMDMFNDSWLTSTPQVANTRTISSCIEFFLYSGKKALPVYFNSNTPVFNAADASLITFDKKKNVMRIGESKKNKNENKEEDGFLPDSYQLQGIIDEYTIMMWFAECCPTSVTEKSKIERKSVVQIQGGRRRSSVAQVCIERRTSSMIGRSSGLMFAMPQMGGRSRRTSFNSAVGSQWRDMGLLFAGSTIQHVLKDFTVNPHAKRGYKSNFECILVKDNAPPESPEQQKAAEDYDEENENGKKLRCEVCYCLHDIFQTDQFMYNVVEMISRGYRNVPLAASRTRPYVVSHIISSAEVASFLRLYAKECLGKLASTTIIDSGLMKVPLVVACSLNYGSAIQHLKQFKVDTAAIIDEEGRWVGRLDCSSAAIMWWRWKSLGKGLHGGQDELDELRSAFAEEQYEEFDVSSIKNYSAFSMMMNPLKECSSIGIKIYDFKSQFKVVHEKKTFAEEEEGSDSSSTSSSSSDSDSESSTSSSSSSSNSDSDSDSDEDEDTELGGASKLSMSTASKVIPGGKPVAPQDSVRDKVKEAKALHEKQFTDWLRNQGLVLEHDTIASALEVMSLFKTTKAFVVNAFGEVIGVVSIKSIAVEILKYEKKMQKENYKLAVEEDKEDD